MKKIINTINPIIINLLFSISISILGYLINYITDGIVDKIYVNGTLHYANQKFVSFYNDNIIFDISFVLFGLVIIISIINILINKLFNKKYYFSIYIFTISWIFQIIESINVFYQSSFFGTIQSGNILFYLWFFIIIISMPTLFYLRFIYHKKD